MQASLVATIFDRAGRSLLRGGRVLGLHSRLDETHSFQSFSVASCVRSELMTLRFAGALLALGGGLRVCVLDAARRGECDGGGGGGGGHTDRRAHARRRGARRCDRDNRIAAHAGTRAQTWGSGTAAVLALLWLVSDKHVRQP
eukprot:6203419-Pleurochrysis_carterae.AAC.1